MAGAILIVFVFICFFLWVCTHNEALVIGVVLVGSYLLLHALAKMLGMKADDLVGWLFLICVFSALPLSIMLFIVECLLIAQNKDKNNTK